MYLKFRLDSPAVSFIEVRKELNDSKYLDISNDYFSFVLRLFISKLDYLKVTKANASEAHKKHFWVSVNSDGKVFLSRTKPTRAKEKFTYTKDTAIEVPVEFLDYAGVNPHPLDEPILFTY